MQVQDNQYRLQVIRDAFLNDEKIYQYFDPNETVSSVDEIADNILEKIVEHEQLFDCEFKEVQSGYVFYIKEPRVLVSFGCRVSDRSGDFFKEITDTVGDTFACYLWSKNTRAINWLQKNGLIIEQELDNITILRTCL